MSLLALTLADFQAQLPFSNKIEDAQLRPFIDLTRTLDLIPMLGHATLEAVNELPAFSTTEYTAGLVATAGQYVSRYERVYYTAAGTSLAPPAKPDEAITGWEYKPLQTLWRHYLKGFWVQQSFARFLPQHGKNLTKAGVTQAIDRGLGTYDRPSTAERSELQASVDVTAEALKSRLTRFLREEHLLFASCGCGYNYYPTECATAHRTTSRLHARRVRGV